MAVGEKANQKKVQAVMEDLRSGNEQKFSAAIKTLHSIGNVSVLTELLDLLRTDLSEKNRQELLDTLNDLNDSDAIPVIMEALRDEVNHDIRRDVLTTIWNSKLDYSAYLPDFVAMALDGDFMDALECLTVIENMEGPFGEHLILESQLHMKEYLEDTAPKDPQKAKIISEIAIFIKDLNDADDDGIEEFNV